MEGVATMHVLIGVDNTSESEDAVETAFKFFGSDATYTLLSVSSGVQLRSLSYGAGTVYSPQVLADRYHEAERHAETAAASAEENLPLDVMTTIDIETGQAGPVIVDKARELDADVVVIGSRDRSIWDRLFEPSAGRHIVDNAPCPVVVVR